MNHSVGNRMYWQRTVCSNIWPRKTTPISRQGWKRVQALTPNPRANTVSGDAQTPTEDEYLSGFRLVAVLSAVTMAAFLMLLDTSVVVTAIPKITTHFGSTEDIGWYGSAYLLCNCSLQPLGGKLYTHFSSKLTFIYFLGLFELGSLICGVAVSSHMLIVGRAVAGMGGTGLVMGALTITATSVPLNKRPLTMGTLMGTANVGNVLGPLIGGALTEYTTWRWCFFIILPCGAAIVAALLFIHVPEGRKAGSKESSILATLHMLDLGGFVTFAPAIVMFLLALNWGGTTGYPWSSGTVIGLFVGAAVMFGVFLAWEYHRGDTAMVPLAMFKQRVVTAGCIVQLFQMGAMMVSIYYLPVWFQAILGKSPSKSGVFIIPLVGSQIVNSVVVGALITAIGYYLPFGIVGNAIGAIGTGLLTTFLPNTKTGAWIGYQILTGFRGMTFQIPVVAVQNHLPKESIAIGNLMLVFTQNFGGTIFLSFADLIFQHTLSTSMAKYAPDVNTQDILTCGATGFRDHVSKEDFPGVLMAYDKAITTTFYLAMGAAAMATVGSCGLGWKSVKKPKVSGA